jgi:hypothetical protein
MTHLLPSGRSVAIETVNGQEAVTIRAVDGSLEVRIEWTSTGPVVRLAAAKLQVAAAEVDIACENFQVNASGEVRMKATGPIRLNGETVRLNCTEEPVSEAPLAERR